MSREHVETIMRAYEAFNRGAPEESGLNMSPNFEFIPPPILPEGGVSKGPEGFMDFLRTWNDAFDDFRFEVEEVIDAGDAVLVMAAVRGTGKDSGIDIASPSFAHVWRFDGAQVAGMEAMPNRATAFETLGLGDQPGSGDG